MTYFDLLKESAYSKGKTAYSNGLSLLDNPHSSLQSDKRLFFAWESGWKEQHYIRESYLKDTMGASTVLCPNCSQLVTSPQITCKNCGIDISKALRIETKSRMEARKVYIDNILLLPFRLLWNIIVIVGTIWLEVLWIGFVFGSVAGVILLLIFWIEGFLFPLILFSFCTELWPRGSLDTN